MALRNTELPLDVIWPRLIAIADEMATTMFRTAFSHDVAWRYGPHRLHAGLRRQPCRGLSARDCQSG